MFEVSKSVQIKPFSLKIGIINKKKSFFQSLRISGVMPRFAASCKTYHKTAKVDRFLGLQNVPIPGSLWVTLVKIGR